MGRSGFEPPTHGFSVLLEQLENLRNNYSEFSFLLITR